MEKNFFSPVHRPAHADTASPLLVKSNVICHTPDQVEEPVVDLNDFLVSHQPGTFIMRVNTQCMTGAGIFPGDTVIVDRLMAADSGKIIIAMLDGELLIRRLNISNYRKRLVPETASLSSIDVDASSSFEIWGVVTFVIHRL